MPKKERFSRQQFHILLLCFLCYSAAYTGRLNLSAVLADLKSSLLLTDLRAGIFQTMFAMVYAAGQIVNGMRADRVSARLNIALGLILSALCNAAFALCSNYLCMVILWAFNGAAQSMLWTPIVRLTAAWFQGRQRERASIILSVTIIFGHLAAWGISGILASALNWRCSFIVPAGLMTLAGAAAWLFLRQEAAPGSVQRPARTCAVPAMPLGPMLRSTGLAALLLCCVCNGFVRDGIVSWAPVILSLGGGSLSVHSTLLSLIIPLLNLLGVLLVRRCYHLLRGSARGAVGTLLMGSAVISALLFPASGAFFCALLMGLCCAANYGVNPMITTLIPMQYENAGRVGLVAGLADCFIYLGSALAGVATGALSDAAGWRWVYAAWAFISLLGAALAFLSVRGEKKLHTAEVRP